MRKSDDRTHCKIRFVSDDPEVPMREYLWAEPLGDDRYQIKNAPFFFSAVNHRDIIIARVGTRDSIPEFVHVVERSGHRTVHVSIPHSSLSEHRDVLEELVLLFGVTIEGTGQGLYAVDVNPQVDYEALVRSLDAKAASGVLCFSQPAMSH